MKRMFVIVFFALASVGGFVLAAWYIVVPVSVIETAVEENLSSGDVSFNVVGLSKGIPINLNSERVDVLFREQRLISIRDVNVRLKPSALARMKIAVVYEGEVGRGILRGSAGLNRAGQTAEFTLSGASLSALGLSDRTGLRGDGIVDLEIHMEGSGGTLRFSVKELDLGVSRVLGVQVPVEEFRTARGFVHLEKDRAELESVTLEGENFYARARGTISGSVADLEVELMPEENETLSPELASLIRNYRVSGGYYVIPVKGDISFLFAP